MGSKSKAAFLRSDTVTVFLKPAPYFFINPCSVTICLISEKFEINSYIKKFPLFPNPCTRALRGLTFSSAWPCWGSIVLVSCPRRLWAAPLGWGERSGRGWHQSGCVVWNGGSTSSWTPLCCPASDTQGKNQEWVFKCELLRLRINRKRMCNNYIHGEIVVIGNSQISQFAEVHVPTSNRIHDEDVGGEAQCTTCRLEVESACLLQNVTAL